MKKDNALKGFEVIGKTRKGIEIEDKRYILRGSHNALIDSLSWMNCPLFLQVKNQRACFDMFWVSSLLERDISRIIPILRGNELDVELSRFDKRILHVGPVFISLYWVTSRIKELREGKMTADLPLFGTMVRYRPGLPKIEVMKVYRDVRSFIEKSLKKRGFNGACFWGFIKDEIVGPNIFYFARTKRTVHGTNLYDGEELDHSFYFELGDELTSHTKSKYVDFFVSSKGEVRYSLKRMRLLFEVFDKDTEVVESIEIPFCNFLLSIRSNDYNFRPECYEGDI